MTLAACSKIGAYEIHSLLGAGGMGEVYKARDTKLGRDVALKILPELFAHDPDRLARFQREAQVLALLNHLNIAAIYGLGESARKPPTHGRLARKRAAETTWTRVRPMSGRRRSRALRRTTWNAKSGWVRSTK